MFSGIAVMNAAMPTNLTAADEYNLWTAYEGDVFL